MPGASPPSPGLSPWRCPVCRQSLPAVDGEARLACAAGHSFDIAREGYVNLLVRKGRGRQPGDSREMVEARRRFLASGKYDPMTEAVADAVVRAPRGATLLDVGCGDGHHTRALAAGTRIALDVAKPAVAAAARADPGGWYAVASAADLPLTDGAVDTAVNIFGPIFADELLRVVRPAGTVVVAHPGPDHLSGLRHLVYDDARPHEVKAPLRAAPAFEVLSSLEVRWPLTVDGSAQLGDLFAMTPYRWHAPPDIHERIEMAVAGGFRTVADVRVTTYRRR